MDVTGLPKDVVLGCGNDAGLSVGWFGLGHNRLGWRGLRQVGLGLVRLR